MHKNGWESQSLPVTNLPLEIKNRRFQWKTTARGPREFKQQLCDQDKSQSVVTNGFAMKTCLAAAVLLAALLAPSTSAQYIYVANAGEDTVSKIDINTNTEVARYATWFTSTSANHFPQPHHYGAGPAPSRLLQDSAGNLYVLNRWFGNSHRPVLLKIAPTGGNPGSTTSNGPGILPMLDNGTTNNEIDAGDSKDARIQWGQPIGMSTDAGAWGRALCMDTSGILWVGMYNTERYYKVDPATGLMLGPAILTPGHKPYGCQVSTDGKLWSVNAGSGLVEIDTATNVVTPRNHATFGVNYSLSLFNACDSTSSKVYLSERSGTPRTFIAYDPQTSTFSNPPLAIPQFASVAVGVDLNGNIVSGKASGGRVIKTSPTGNLLWDTNALPAGPVVQLGSLPPQDLHGIIIDEHNDVWAVHLFEDRVVKYSGVDGHLIATVKVGRFPYTYGNPPPPTCPCAEIRGPRITCEKQSNGTATYPWSFTFTNHSPFATPATAINITSTQVTNITPSPFVFTNPVPPNGQANVSGTFTVANPVPGTRVCLDITLNAGRGGWCCPPERVCFVLPECATGCAALKAAFKCQGGQPVLSLVITNQGPAAANSVTVFSNTPGVTVTPQTTTQTFPQNTQVQIPLTVTGAAPGQTISLTASLNGPIDPKTGLNDWCCTSTVTVTYPERGCPIQVDGWIFNDLNRNGLRDSGEDGLSGWTVTLTDGKGKPRSTTSDATGIYHFENVDQDTYRVSVQPPRGWSPTVLEGGVHTVNVAGQQNRTFDFGFVKTQQ